MDIDWSNYVKVTKPSGEFNQDTVNALLNKIMNSKTGSEKLKELVGKMEDEGASAIEIEVNNQQDASEAPRPDGLKNTAVEGVTGNEDAGYDLSGAHVNVNQNQLYNLYYKGADGQYHPYTPEQLIFHELMHFLRWLNGESHDHDSEIAEEDLYNLDPESFVSDDPIMQILNEYREEVGAEPRKTYNEYVEVFQGDTSEGTDYDSSETPEAPSPFKDPDLNLMLDLALDGSQLSDVIQNGIMALMDNALDRGSPLVLDLDGDGIELSSYSAAQTVYFDLDEDGEAEQTGWVDADDGLLAVDVNENGIIDDNSELFGSMTEDGFSQLNVFDSNGDGVIDASDSDFEKLLVWQDLNQDGRSQVNELKTLDDLNITEIDLGATEVDTTLDGHVVSHESTFSIDGQTQDIKDIWFTHSTVNTINIEDYDLDFAALALPSSRGYGDLKAWHIAMSIDNSGTDNMQSLMQDIADKDFDDLFTSDTSLMDDVRDVMFRWAGVDGVATDSRGSFVNGRELAFLEAMMGQEFNQRGISNDPLGPFAGYDLADAFRLAENMFYGRILAQVAGAELFEGDFYYDYTTDTIEGVTGLDSTKLAALETEATALSTMGEKETFWGNVVRMVEYSVGTTNLPSGDQADLDTAITNSDATLNLTTILSSLVIEYTSGVTDNGTSSADVISGGAYDDVLNGAEGDDDIEGLAGNDEISGGDDDDILNGGAGDDYILGGSGNDVYEYNPGDGVDAYLDSTGTDKILFGSGITISDLTMVRLGNSDLQIDIDTGTYTGQIIVEDQFAGNIGIETLEFSDASTFDLTTVDWSLTGTDGDDSFDGTAGGDDTIDGGAGDDLIKGDDGDDTLIGGTGDDDLRGEGDDDILDAGAGDDVMRGGYGNDVYIYTSGHDVISDLGGTDEIQLPSGYTSGNVEYYRFGSDLQIVLDDDNSIYIESFFNTGRGVETLRYSDNSTTDLSTITATNQGTENADYLVGTANADVLIGLGGDDTFNGGDGNDVIDGGAGDDYIASSSGDDTIYAGTGADRVLAGTGNDIIYGGAGDDDLEGQDGNDTYVYSSGNDELDDSSGTDTLRFIDGWEYEDLSFSRYVSDSYDLKIEINGGNTITVDTHFFTGGGSAIEYIEFADSTTIDITYEQITSYGTTGDDSIGSPDFNNNLDDIIYGYEGNDTLYGEEGNDLLYGGDDDDTLLGDDGNDILHFGSGDDFARGGDGDDIYVYTEGLDHIKEVASGTDTVQVENGLTIHDIDAITIDSLDVTFEFDTGTNELLVEDLKSSTVSRQIEDITFSDGYSTSLLDFEDWTFGTTGNDAALNGTTGVDVLIGRAGDDVMDGGLGNDDLLGGEGDDTLDGGAGDDVLYGEAGNDTYIFSGGLDTIYETGGTDTLKITGAYTIDDITLSTDGDDIVIVVNSGTDEITLKDAASSDSSNYIETIEFDDASTYALFDALDTDIDGTVLNDTLNGSNLENVIEGYDGNDVITGNEGDDTLKGGAGDDIYIFNPGDGQDTIIETSGTDRIVLGEGFISPEVVTGRDGDDYVISFLDHPDDEIRIQDHFVPGGDHIETIELQSGLTIPIVYAVPILGDDYNNTIYGTSSDDLIFTGDGNDGVYAGDGNDEVHLEGWGAAFGEGGNDVLYAHSTSYAALRGGAGSDIMYGGTGNDYFEGGDGDDFIFGREGTDTIYGNDGSDIIYGGAARDVIYAGEGNNIIYGDFKDDDTNGGNDSIIGGSGDEVVYGGGDNDYINLYDGEDLAYGGDGNDQIRGSSSGNNTFYGQNGNDSLYGAQGADYLVGGAGDDNVYGYGGNDDFVYTSGIDTYYNGGGADNVLFEDATLTLNDIDDMYADGDDLRVVFNSGTDEIVINDMILGGGYNPIDFMIFGDGFKTSFLYSDWEKLTTGNDTETYTGYEVRLIAADDGDDDLDFTTGVNYVHGGNGDDTIDGGSSSDTIHGGLDDDTIYGRGYNDTIWGGEGNDTIYGGDTTASSGYDKVYAGDGDDTVYWDELDTHLEGGDGYDLAKIYGAGTSETFTYDSETHTGFEEIDLTDGEGNDAVDGFLSIQDVIDFSDTDALYVLGDSGDEVDVGGTWTREADVEVSGTDFAHFTGVSGITTADIYIEIGLDFNSTTLTELV